MITVEWNMSRPTVTLMIQSESNQQTFLTLFTVRKHSSPFSVSSLPTMR